MELLRHCLFIYLLAILLSLSISSTTNSDHTNEWKGGDGAKLSRVRRQNLNLPDALRLPEKSYALYIFWRLLNEVSNQTNTIRTSTEGPKNTEIAFKAKDKPSSAPTQKQITHSTGITGTNNSTVMASFPTDQSSPDSQKTTESGDLRLLKQSTQGLQATIQKMPEPSQVTDLIQKPDSTKFKISSKRVEEPSLDTMHEETTRSTCANDSTAITSFSTERPQQESQKSTQSGAPRLFTQSTQHLQHSKQETSEPSQVTEQHIPDSTTVSIKTSSKAAEEPSSTIIHEKNDHFIGITNTKDSTDMASFPTHPQKTTQSGDSQLVEQLTTAKQKITEPSQVTEQHIPHSKTFTSRISSEAVEEPALDIMHEETTRSTGANNSTAITSFSTEQSPQESQKSTQSGAPRLFTQSSQHLQHSKQETSEPSQVTEQHIPDSTTVSIKISSKAAEEPSSTIIHEKNDHFIGITNTKDSTDMASFPTHPQKTTQSGDSQLVEQLTTAKQKITEPSQVTEQHIPHSKTFTSRISSEAVEEPALDIMHEETTRSTGANNSTAITSFSTEQSPQESQKSTQSGAPRLFTQSTQHLQHSKQETSEPSQVTEQHIPDSTTVSIKISSKAAEEPSSTIIHEKNDHFIGITNTKDSTDMASFPTHPPDSQKTTQSGDSHLVEQLTTAKQKITEPSQVTEQHIPHSKTFTSRISSEAVEEPALDIMHEETTRSTSTNDSTAITSFSTERPQQESQKSTQSGAPRLFTQSTQHLQHSKQETSEPSQVTEQHIPDSTTVSIKISSKAAEEPSSTIIHEKNDHFIGITNTKDSTDMASFPTHPPDSQKTTQSGDSHLVEQLTTAKQKITEPSQVTEQHILHSKTFTSRISSEAVEEPALDIMHEETTRSTGANNSTAITSFPTEQSPQESQKSTQSGAPRLFTQSTQHLQHSKQETSEPSQVTEQHIPDSTTVSIKISSKAAEEPSSTIIHEKNDHFIGITNTKDSTDMASFPTHPPDSQKTTQSGDSHLVEQLKTAKQKITEPSQVTEQHIPHSKTFTSRISSEAVEEPALDIMHEETTHSTGANNSTAITSFPTEQSPQESQKSTQSGAPRLFTQSTQHLQHSKQETSEPSQVTEQHIPDSTTVSIKISSKAAEEPSSTIIHEKNDHFIGITNTKDSTDMASFPTHPPDSQKTTQSGDSHLVEQLTTAKQKITEPSQVTEQHIPHSKTFTSRISSEAVEEPALDIMHEETTRSTGANNSTAITSFSTEQSPQESQKSTQSGAPRLFTQSTQHLQHSKQETSEPSQVTEQHIPDSTTVSIKTSSKAAEEPSSTTIYDEIAITTDSTAILSFHTDLPSQKSQKSTQSGVPQLLKQSTHFQSPKTLKPREEILQPTALISTPDMTTTYINEKETPLQTAINSHIRNHGILASTRVNQSLQPTSLPQTMKNEHQRRVITGMVNDISKPTLPARTKNPTLSSSKVKLDMLKTATYTHSVTQYNGNPNQFVTATDRRVLKPTLPVFTLKQQDATSLLLTEESPISYLNGFTSDPERSKPTPAKEPTNQHTEQNANNTEKSSRDGLIQYFMTTKTHILTNDSSVSSKTASTSHLPGVTEDRLVDSGGPGDTSVPTGVSLHVSTSSAAPFWTIQNQMNAKTQSQSATNKYPILGTITSHASVILVKDTSTQAPIDRVRPTQTIPVSTEKLPMTFTPKPSEKDARRTSVTRHGTQKIPSWISTKWSNLQPTETEPQSGLTNQEPTADTAAKKNYTKNDLLPMTDKPTQRTIGRKWSKMTHTATTKLLKTQKVSHNSKKTHKSADTAIKDDTQSDRGIFGLLFTLGCLILLLIAILLRVVWRRWQTRHWRNNTWVAGSPSVLGIYSVWQSSSPHTAIDMKKRNTQKNEQEQMNVYESVALMQQLKDFY